MIRLRSYAFVFLVGSILAGCGGEVPNKPTPVEPEPLPPLPEVQGIGLLEDINSDERIVEVNLVARTNIVQLLSGDPTRVYNYNDQFPGPMIHARVGDRVIVHFTNDLTEPTVVHWHGLRISDLMDGSPILQDPVQPGMSFTYDFVVPEAGTFWYHTHLNQIKQLEYGLYGAIVVHEEKDIPAFSAERIFVGDDVRLASNNQISGFLTSGPDIGAGRVGNTLLVNGKVINGDDGPLKFTIPRGAIERWRFVLATNALSYGLRVKGADTRVIATDGGLLPEPFALDRVEIAPGQRYDFEVRPRADATEVTLEALILVVNENNEVVEATFELARATIEGEIAVEEPKYPPIVLPATEVAADALSWKLAGALVDNKVEFTINGMTGSSGDEHEHILLHTFEPNVPAKITITSSVSPKHPFHLHGQFFQIIARNGKPVFEPGLRDTVEIRGDQSATILSYFENPGRWMVHCHISEHSENGMMADIQVGDASNHSNHTP